MKYDIIIIGAGAAGLMAMKELLGAGYKVCLLEAAAIAGGRMATLKENGFSMLVETGAEFVHGKLPLTLSLLDEANIPYLPVAGKMIAVENGRWKKNEAHDKHWETFMHQLGKLKTDTSIAQFLDENFSDDRYAHLREAVQHYAEGFDLANIGNASALAVQREWSHEEETQYRIPGGYNQLVDYFISCCTKLSGSIHYNTTVTKIEYNKEAVVVSASNNQQFEATRLIITVSAGVLQSGALQFVPALQENYANAIQQLGFGDVIKILLQFSTAFWKDYADDIGFLLSNESIPTWWTQLPIENNLLTGWLGGPGATAMAGETDETILQSALRSLSNIFDRPAVELQQQMLHYKINCWHNHPHIKGGYSYITTESVNAKKILSHPLHDTVFFAGEAFHRGESQGTVEAALQNGKLVAEKIKEVGH